MHWVKNAEYLDANRLAVEFEDGVVKNVDLEKYLNKGILIPLQQADEFKNFRVNHDTDTIEWENGADLSPDFLYEIGVTTRRSSNAA